VGVISLFAKAWKEIEEERPLPRRLRQLKILSFEEMKQKVLEQDPLFVSSIVDSLYSGDVYILKGAFPVNFFVRLRQQLFEDGKNKPSEFYPMLEGAPNYHRVIDEEITKKYTFESIKHSHYFFPWNPDPYHIFSTAYPRWRVIKQLSGLRADEYEHNTPKDGIVDRLQIVQYPSGAGRIETHSDPYQAQRLIISCFMTKRGKDYMKGGVYFINAQNEKVDCEDLIDVGDMQIYFPTILHGVEMIDVGTTLDWNSPAGRWWFGPFSNSSNQVDQRYTGYGVKDTNKI